MAFRPDRLNERMEAKGIKQKELAEAVGISDRAIRDYQKGESIPNGDHLALLVQALDTTVDYLYGRSDDPYPNLHLNEDERAFILWRRSFPGEPAAEDIDNFLISQHAAKKPRPRPKR